MTMFRPPADAWSRRDFMRNGSYSLALVCTFGTTSSLKGSEVTKSSTVTSAARRAQAASPFKPFQRDLPIMPELSPVSTKNGTDVYEVDIKEGTAEILPGFETPIYGYEGIYPGPTIRARKGRTAVVRQKNNLSFDSNVHLHGGYVPAAHDGHPMDVIQPGNSFDYVYPNDQDAAFLWYHDHAHGRTARTLYYGLVATYLLGDEREEELELPRDEYDVPIVLADHAFNKDGSFRYAENVDLGFRGDTLLVNGAVSPRMAVQRRIYRLRFLNASNARTYDLKLGNGRQMLQIASDGGLLERPVARSQFPLHPAERIEVLIDFRSFRPGSQIVLQNTSGEATTKQVMRFDVVEGGGSEDARMPRGRMRTLPKLPEPNATPPLGPLAADVLGRAVADRQPRVRPDADRRLAAAGDLGAVAVAQPVQPRAPDAPARDALPRRGALLGRHPPRRAGLEGHDRRAPERDGHGPAVVHPLRGPLRVPLPFARTRRQGDDAAAGGGQVRRAVSDRGRSRAVRRRTGAGAGSPRRRSPAWTRSRGTRPTVDDRARAERPLDVPRHHPGPQRLVGHRALAGAAALAARRSRARRGLGLRGRG